jgi:dTDP-L-rhamnose 4-epimerase
MKILVTGGAGFIGSHIVDGLIQRGHTVRVIDNLAPQVHGDRRQIPGYLNSQAEFILGDVRDREVLATALEGAQAVFHQAAAVGVGQSMYQIHHYMDHNTRGTAVLLELLTSGEFPVGKLIVASSMSIYGEGEYLCRECGPVHPRLRSEAQLRRRSWELRCPHCGQGLTPVPTPEDKPACPTSIYAISKRDQEEMCLTVGQTYGIPTVALRYFNTYGPRQALSNPYTGIAAIFSTAILNGNPPLIFEDGLQSRDLIHVKDLVQANLLVLESSEADYQVFNVGTGKPTTILGIAELLLEHLDRPDLEPQIVEQFRAGDIRHCYADIARIQALGFTPRISLDEGIRDLIQWLPEQENVQDQVETAIRQLNHRGLIR